MLSLFVIINDVPYSIMTLDIVDGHIREIDIVVNPDNLPAVEIGLKHLTAIGMETIHERTTSLTGWLLDALLGLHHTNGMPLVQIYGPQNTHTHGATIALNFLNAHGQIIDERVIDRRASIFRISLRRGASTKTSLLGKIPVHKEHPVERGATVIARFSPLDAFLVWLYKTERATASSCIVGPVAGPIFSTVSEAATFAI